MHVIIMTSNRDASGGSRQAVYLAQALHAAGHTVDFASRPGSELVPLAPELHHVALPKKLCEVGRTLRSLMKPGEPVILHAFHNRGVKHAAYLGFLWRLMGLPVACIAHRGVTAKPGNPLPYLLPGIRYFLVNSKACADVLPLLWRRGRCAVVSNSVPEERLRRTRTAAEMRAALGIPEDHFVPGVVANDDKHKGVGPLLEAYARAALPASTLVVVGVEPARWKPLCEQLGISGRVRLIPRTEAVADYLQTLSLFVLPSLTESQPNVLMEAMCLGLPAIGSNTGGVPDMLPGEFLFEPGKVEEMADMMVRMSRDAALLQRSVENSGLQSRRFTTAHRLERVLEYYQKALDELPVKARQT